MQRTHVSVLLHEAIEGLGIQPGCWYIDGTFGRGGHTREILKLGGKVIAFDVDVEAISFGNTEFHTEIENGQLVLIRENFEKLEGEINKLKSEEKIGEIKGALFDFGVSSPQLDTPERGFSFQFDADLDMRMDDRLGVKAKDLLMVLSEKQLTEVFIELGGEQEARKIAKAICYTRQKHRIETTRQLAELIERTKRGRRGHLHPATKVFQALRILVNDELTSVQQVLPQALRTLASQGRLVTISFHEGEDRIVKHTLKNWEKNGEGKMISDGAITATEEELKRNPRARSAKLRIFEKK